MTTKKHKTKDAAARAAAFMASAEATERALDAKRLHRAKDRVEALKASGAPERLAHLEKLLRRLDPVRPATDPRLFPLVQRSLVRIGRMINQVTQSEDRQYDPQMEVEVNLLWEQIAHIKGKRDNAFATHQKQFGKRMRERRCKWLTMAIQADESLLGAPLKLRDAAKKLAKMNGASSRDLDELTLYSAKAYARDVRSLMAERSAAHFSEIEAILPSPGID